MHFSTLATAITLMSTTGWAQYALQDDYFSGDFFSNFAFWDSSTDGADPTHGFVTYLNQKDAQNAKLVSSSSSNAKMMVDSTNDAPNGRNSVRLTSTKTYQSGLVVLDLEHMPGGVCGTWPAFWMVGPNWPAGGEIDIIEGVNDQNSNDITLHTGSGCSVGSGSFTGNLTTSNCDINAAGQQYNAGCQIQADNDQSYGSGFNSNNGGVYATEITGSAINIWFFPRSSVPGDATGDSPNPSNWGKPTASFRGGCDISSSFQNMQIVFDTTFCGDWAGDTWSSSSCSQKSSTCDDFVANNPSAFTGAYWSVNALKVYSGNGQNGPSNPTSSTPSSPSFAPSSTSAVLSSNSMSDPTPSADSSSFIPSSVLTSQASSFTPVPTSSFASPTQTASPSVDSSQSFVISSTAYDPWGSRTRYNNPSPTYLQETPDSSGGYDVGFPAAKARRGHHLRHHQIHAAERRL